MAVTPFCKRLTLILFIALPFLGFLLGIRYQGMIDNITQVEKDMAVSTNTDISISTPTPSPDSQQTQSKTCGGLAGGTCAKGYTCVYPSPIYPDAVGTCIKM